MRTILIVDDSATARRIIQQCLEMIGCAGCEFVHAADGIEALGILRSRDISLLITLIILAICWLDILISSMALTIRAI